MANNTILNVGAGGDTLRDLDRSGVKTAIVALDLNPAGSETLMAGAMPSSQSGTWTVTANIGTAGTLALDATLTGGTQKTKLIDSGGTNVATVSAAGAVKVDGSAVTQPVSGTFWQATQPVSGTVSITANSSVNLAQLAGTTTDTNSGNKSAGTLRIVIATDQPALTNALKVDGSAVTQPVSGTFWQATQPVSGTFWQATQPVSGTVSVNALPAGTNLVGQVSASDETGTVYSGTTALTPKFALISVSASGPATVVAAVGGKRIRVLRWSLSSNGSVNVKWQSHVTPTDLTGLHYLTQYASAGGAYCPLGIFQTVSGEALDINLSGAVAVGGELTYVEV